MGSIHNPFPIDLTLAEMVFPALAAAAHSLDHVPHFYESTDGFFTRNFLGLFTNPEAPLPSQNSRSWDILMKLYQTAKFCDISDPLMMLAQNNNRMSISLSALGTILKP